MLSLGWLAKRNAYRPIVNHTIRVDAEGTISGKAPRGALPGEYETPIDISEQRPSPKGKRLDLPSHDAQWDDNTSLNREDIYGDDGRWARV
jgi:hypothetical protein